MHRNMFQNVFHNPLCSFKMQSLSNFQYHLAKKAPTSVDAFGTHHGCHFPKKARMRPANAAFPHLIFPSVNLSDSSEAFQHHAGKVVFSTSQQLTDTRKLEEHLSIWMCRTFAQNKYQWTSWAVKFLPVNHVHYWTELELQPGDSALQYFDRNGGNYYTKTETVFIDKAPCWSTEVDWVQI